MEYVCNRMKARVPIPYSIQSPFPIFSFQDPYFTPLGILKDNKLKNKF
jgi:hypothetical protein